MPLPMAVWSSDLYLTTHFPSRTNFSKPLCTISISQNLSLTNSSSSRFLIIHSSKPSSPLLQSASNELETTHLPYKSPDQQLPTVPDVEISNEFIKGLCKASQTESHAYEYYEKAKHQPEFQPDPETLKLLILGLVKSKQWSIISALVEDFRAFNVFPDGATCARLTSRCIRARKFKLAESLLRVLVIKKQVAVPAFASAMRSYNKLHMFRSTVSVYDQMREAGVSLDANGYFCVMDAHRKLRNTEKVLALFLEFESKKLDSKEFYTQIYFILCDSLGKSGRAFEALRHFREMVGKGIPPNHSFYASLISSFVGIKEAEVAEDLFQEAREKGMIKDPAVFQKLVIMYVKLGLVEKTLSVVEAMKEMEILVSDCVFCTIVNGYVKQRGTRASATAYEQMIFLGCEPGQVTYASIINVYCSLGLPKKAETLFMEMIGKSFDKCLVAYSSMISMYGKIGKVNDAMRLLARMKEKGCEPNVWVYNSLLDMHGRFMNLRQVKKLWKEMERRKIVPDRISYTSIISACSKAREFEECMRLYQEFRMKRGKADRALAGIMVGVFSKSSRIDELLKLLQELKAEGTVLDGRLYKSALNALRDAGLQAQVQWFKKSFSFVKDKT